MTLTLPTNNYYSHQIFKITYKYQNDVEMFDIINGAQKKQRRRSRDTHEERKGGRKEKM